MGEQGFSFSDKWQTLIFFHTMYVLAFINDKVRIGKQIKFLSRKSAAIGVPSD